ncbi:MAG TPA: hypothetical protein VGH63_03005 [Polyangia bacterium]
MNDSIESGCDQTLRIARQCLSGERDDGNLGKPWMRPQLAEERAAVTIWKKEIEQHDVEDFGGNELTKGRGVDGNGDRMPRDLQEIARELRVERIVLDEKDS